MLVPSIDISKGETVQLVQGKELALTAGSPLENLNRFSAVGEVAVIDLDSAMGVGSNADVIKLLLRKGRCRVGGGIRSLESAIEWLDAGAEKIILGTKAVPEILMHLPRDRVIAAVDAYDDEIVVEGWTRSTGRSILDGIKELRDYVGGFLITFVEREGQLSGTKMGRVRELVEAAAPARVTIAGGVTTTSEIKELDELGADAQVGMALYTGRMQLSEAFLAPVVTDRPDRLIPTIVTDERGVALGLVYSNQDSVSAALAERRGVYFSRKRGLWRKGQESGAIQELLRIDVDCDRDTLRFMVKQHGTGFCHTGSKTCFGRCKGLGALESRVMSRASKPIPGSYTSRLLEDRDFLNSKIEEEAAELASANTPQEVIMECADLLYFAQTALVRAGVGFQDVEQELDFRALKVSRRPGERKDS